MRVGPLADVIAIDGPGGSGKGTVAGRLASELGWHLLDSGALYRVVGLIALRRAIEFDDAASLAEAARRADIGFRGAPATASSGSPFRVVVDGIDETDAIRSAEVEQPASRVAAVPAVREALHVTQQSFRRPPGLVADGRDMGTVVFPDAPAKIFLTASAEERAQRRYKQLIEKGLSANLADLVQEIEERDRRDASRPVAPLKPAEDALMLDSTGVSIDEVVTRAMAWVRQRIAS